VSIATTLTKLQTFNLASSGIASAPAVLPAQLADYVLPCALTFVGPAGWNEHAIGLKRQARMFYIRVYVKPVSQGISLNEGYQACVPILEALGNTYLEDPTLGNTIDHIGTRGEFRDGGIGVLEYAGVPYHGFQLDIEVVDKTT